MPLLAHAHGRSILIGRLRSLAGEVGLVVEVAIQLPGEFGGLGTDGRTPAFQEDDRDDLAVLRVRERREPAKARAVVRAGAGLAEDLLLAEVPAKTARRAVFNRAGHARHHLRDNVRDIEVALYLGLKVR